MGIQNGASLESATSGLPSRRPLSALLSQVLVAFTVECDNEFERRMGEAGYAGARLSLMVWANLMRFVGAEGISVRNLAAQALAPDTQVKFALGCLERWGVVVLQPDAPDHRPPPSTFHRRFGRELRDGWGSGRGIRADGRVRLTEKGGTASKIWRPLCGEIERRWEKRFGREEIGSLRETLRKVAGRRKVELPHALPGGWEGAEDFPPRVTRDVGRLPLPTLLSQSLLSLRLEFDRESPVPLVLCANTLRVLGEKPIREAEIPRLTGGSPETAGIGWQIKPFVVVESDPSGRRGKVVRLSPRGLAARQNYYRLVAEIEERWGTKFGNEVIARLREELGGLFERRGEQGSLLAEGLVPPPGTVRGGDLAPALGRRDVGAAAKQRARDLVAQTKAFVSDPAATLPHYPLWDMNRGFGP